MSVAECERASAFGFWDAGAKPSVLRLTSSFDFLRGESGDGGADRVLCSWWLNWPRGERGDLEESREL